MAWKVLRREEARALAAAPYSSCSIVRKSPDTLVALAPQRIELGGRPTRRPPARGQAACGTGPSCLAWRTLAQMVEALTRLRKRVVREPIADSSARLVSAEPA